MVGISAGLAPWGMLASIAGAALVGGCFVGCDNDIGSAQFSQADLYSRFPAEGKRGDWEIEWTVPYNKNVRPYKQARLLGLPESLELTVNDTGDASFEIERGRSSGKLSNDASRARFVKTFQDLGLGDAPTPEVAPITWSHVNCG